MLAVDALHTFYGKSHVLRDVSFAVPAGQITVLLGRNGAGKTTTLRSIMGLTPPRGGAVRFKDRDITGEPPHRVFRLGVGYVPEGRQIFPHLDVGENLRLATRRAGESTRWTLERIFEYFPVLRELEALMVRLKGEGVTILLVEQNARMALAVSDQVLVLSKGTVVFAGPTAEFHRREAELKGRYLSV
ncbi:MAG: ABC transporter ATP-binding protein [Candidatus Rokuibacteriota bacterium]|nr:MAG: ABC transporter ATP-binding protein [Candidatus Rokubacteria bacterium]